MGILQRLQAPGLMVRLFHELLRFSSVGAVGFVVDVGLFNLLRFGSWAPMAAQPLGAKVVSVAVATIITWVGNRHWTFKNRRGRTAYHEIGLFALFSLAGLLIAVGCLWFSHYVLDLTSPLADNISANGVGLGAATAFRFITYRTVVFNDPSRRLREETRR